jgi:hypothetical protein
VTSARISGGVSGAYRACACKARLSLLGKGPSLSGKAGGALARTSQRSCILRVRARKSLPRAT